MKLSEIKAGKTYFGRKRHFNSARTRVTNTYVPYYVLEVFVDRSLVRASCNGAPPMLYQLNSVKGWMTTKPEDDGVIKPWVKSRSNDKF